jgi:hypothetical protein
MSIREMSRVWEKSQAQRTSLLVMLALADMASDDGFCWPGQDTIAEKARTTRRSVISIIDDCVSSGELAYVSRPGQQHAYCLLVGLTPEQRKERLDLFEKRYLAGKLHTCENFSHVKKDHRGCEKIAQVLSKTSHPPVQDYAQNCTRSVIDPSIDPSDKDIASKAGAPPAPPQPENLQLHKHPAIQAFREEARRYPPKSWYQDIIDAAGEDVDRWRRIVKDWVGQGFNPSNVKGRLEVLREGWLSHGKNGGAPATPGTIPRGMEKENRADIKELTPEQAAAVKASIRAQLLAKKETEDAKQNAA